ncbi:MAG: (2Fe-2S)-binding protein [Reichenbachiella sp.]
MADIKLKINGTVRTVYGAEPSMPLLWAIRDFLGLKGTKYGCGKGLCGACTIHLDGTATRSCILPLSAIGEKNITTIEGLSVDGDHPVQQAWAEENVPQCGYCQPGQIMTAASFLAENSNPSDEEIVDHMTGNICRCGTYNRIKKAVKIASEKTG